MANTNTNNKTTNSTPVADTSNAWDYLSGGDDLDEQNLDQRGFRRIQHMNESMTYHRGTSIAMGGYGIKNEDGQAVKIGPTETIKHKGGNSTEMAVAKEIEVALIGFSPRYFVCEYQDPVDANKRNFQIVANYIAPADLPGERAKCRSAISLFLVLKADDKRELYELSFKGYNTDDAAKCISKAKGYANGVSQAIGERLKKAVKYHIFGLWLPLGVGESTMVGSTDQSAVTPPAWKIADGEDLSTRMVSKEDYLKFADLRRELDEYLATGKYSGANRPQLTNGAAAPVALLN